MQREYAEMRNDAYYVTGSCVSLASVIYEYRDGAAAETIRQNFPTLSLEQIHGAIAFYLGHPEEAERCLRDLEKKWEALERDVIPASLSCSAGSRKTESSCWRNRRENSVDADLKHATVAGTLRCADRLDFRRCQGWESR